jgi:hypothetical protein
LKNGAQYISRTGLASIRSAQATMKTQTGDEE